MVKSPVVKSPVVKIDNSVLSQYPIPCVHYSWCSIQVYHKGFRAKFAARSVSTRLVCLPYRRDLNYRGDKHIDVLEIHARILARDRG